MNVGHEDDELKPYIEPDNILNDPIRIGNTSYKILTVYVHV